MADISRLARLVNGILRNVDMGANTIVVDNVKIKMGSGNDAIHATLSGTLTAARTISMPDANVNLSDIATNTSHITSSGSSHSLVASAMQPGDNISDLTNDSVFVNAAGAKAAAVADSITDAVTDIAPSQNAVFDALAGKSDTGHGHVAADISDFDTEVSNNTTVASAMQPGDNISDLTNDSVFVDAAGAKAAAVSDTVYGAGWDAVTDVAPSKNAVYDKITSIDSILSSLAAGLLYKGTFDASGPTPDLDASGASQGDFYKISVAGTVYGKTWAVGDMMIVNTTFTAGNIDNAYFDKIDNTESEDILRDADIGVTVAAQSHNHDSAYSAIGHDHAGVYSPVGHDHSGVYSPVGHGHVAADVSDFASAAKSAAVADSITDAVTDVAPSQNAVFDALAGKQAASANLDEADTFFGATGITGAEAETLSDGSNADSLHEHGKVFVTYTNNTGGQIDAGTIVIASQSVAGEIAVADASTLATCEGVLGVAAENIADEASGRIQIAGRVTVDNTNGGNFDLGKRVYISESVGEADKTAPSTTSSVIFMLGIATGVAEVQLQPGFVAVND